MKGVFITFEGPEGCGKSTQAKLLADLLASMGYRVTLTQDPGGTIIGEKIREVLLDPLYTQMVPLTELFLFLASRHQLVEEKIRKQLDAGSIVISSRYTDATMAYQGYGRGLDLNILRNLNDISSGGINPDLTLLLDIDPKLGLSRVKDRTDKETKNDLKMLTGELDRIEDELFDFHLRVREGYLTLSEREPQRIKKIDANDSIENVQAKVKELVIDVLDKI